MRGYALRNSLLDVPNERSSHSVPTPRGGGIAIVVTGVTAWLFAYRNADQFPEIYFALIGGGTMIAVVGFIDDHRHIASYWRLLIHGVAAAWALAWLPPPETYLFGIEISRGVIAYILAALYLVWLLNLYNFMDGIDGLAGIEAVAVAGCGAILTFIAAPQLNLWFPAACLAAASLGFLVWNFPDARIFMGDAGSGFLGFSIGTLALAAGACDPAAFWGWIILLGCFVVDATVTLLRRLARGHRFDQAHRSHVYQYLARRLGAHPPVSLSYAAITLAWLFPISLLVTTQRLTALTGLVLAWFPLIVAAIWLKAGAPERQTL